MRLETLESRRVLSVESVVDGGTFEVFGTPENDEITAYVEGDLLIVQVNESSASVPSALIDHLVIHGLAGDDAIAIRDSVGQTTAITGDAGNDRISGSQQADRIDGGTGDDAIHGHGGDDTIQGGPGNDLLYGGRGNDTIQGDPLDVSPSPVGPVAVVDTSAKVAVHTLETDAQTTADLRAVDTAPAAQFNDIIYGGPGDDTLAGNAGNDLILGESGNDRIGGGSGNDAMLGGEGDDTISGGAGNDAFAGGDGDDSLSGGEGDDWIFGDATNSIPDDYAGLVDYALRYGNVGRGNDRIDAGAGDDIVVAGNLADSVDAGDGDDIVLGGWGGDRIGGG
ncbi:MAG: hypothetical protein KDA42_05435, partial [Planctomycetales bacterium]|nr:hypothetical protein [Planctomycetales bacterium]